MRRADFVALGTEGYLLNCHPGGDVEMLAPFRCKLRYPLEMHGLLQTKKIVFTNRLRFFCQFCLVKEADASFVCRNRQATKGPPGLPGSAGESGDTGEAGEAQCAVWKRRRGYEKLQTWQI